jgi:hypothetical protein
MTEKDLAEVEKQKEELRGIWADHPEEEGENWLDNFFIDVINWHNQEQVKLLRGLLNNMDITGRLADLERQIEQAISRIEKGE